MDSRLQNAGHSAQKRQIVRDIAAFHLTHPPGFPNGLAPTESEKKASSPAQIGLPHVPKTDANVSLK